MNKKTLAAVIAAGAIAVGSVSVYAAGQLARSSAISEENACNFAFVDAGVSPEDAQIKSIEFEYEHGRFVYEIEFTANGVKYEYTVDSATGSIEGKEEIEVLQPGGKPAQPGSPAGAQPADQTRPEEGRQPGQTPGQESKAPADALIGVEKAKEIAFAAAGVSESDVTLTKAKLDHDNGKTVYEIEFYIAGENEYEYDVDAYTGKITESGIEAWEGAKENPADKPEADGKPEESKARTAPGKTGQNDIGVGAAKDIALKHAGRSSDEVTFTKARQEREDGRLIYDIEFYVDGAMEYEYEIDAATGTILESDEEYHGPDEAEDAEDDDDDDLYDRDPDDDDDEEDDDDIHEREWDDDDRDDD